MLTPLALRMGAHLERGFQRLQPTAGEIARFRALRTALGSWSVPRMIASREYHGSGHQVLHTAVPLVGHLNKAKFQNRARCELCDLVVIVFAAVGANPRVTYLQAKNSPAGRRPIAGDQLKLDMVQWSLLSSRATIAGATSSFTPPADLLSAALLPSVASFGFFFERAAGAVDLAYCSADVLIATPSASRVGGGPSLGRSGWTSFPAPRRAHPCWDTRQFGVTSEVSIAHGLDAFGGALSMLLVGTPVPPRSSLAMSLLALLDTIRAEEGGDALLDRATQALGGEVNADAGGPPPEEARLRRRRGGGRPSVIIVQSSPDLILP